MVFDLGQDIFPPDLLLTPHKGQMGQAVNYYKREILSKYFRNFSVSNL
jgi:hypothetical protein